MAYVCRSQFANCMKTKIQYLRVAVVYLVVMLFANFSQAQTPDSIVNVGAGEYFTTYVTKNGRLFVSLWNGASYVPTDMGLSNIVDVDGAQYTNIAMNSSGAVFIVGVNRTTGTMITQPVPTDATGGAFTGNSKVYGWYQTYMTLRAGNIWYWGIDIIDKNQNGSSTDTVLAPMKLVQPAGKYFSKLVVATVDTYTILALATDGTVWKYTGASPNPVQVTLPSPARDIAAIGCAAFVVETTNDLLSWGILANYLGLNWNTTTPTSIKSKWTAAGCVFPSKELVGNYNTLHIIDANNNLFGAGDNVMGEIGNGDEWPTWRTYMNGATLQPYAWSWAHAERLVPNPVRIPGKVKNLKTSNTITFYFYVQDMANNWYSWGRNKARSLGNGQTLNFNDEAIYPNFRDVTAPVLVTPLTQTWTILPAFNVAAAQAPQANAGINQYIALSSTTLYGQGSSQQEGTISSYAWSKVSGPACTIVSPTVMNTSVTGLTNGTYVFNLTVTNNTGVTASSTVKVVVDPMYAKVFADAGDDTTVVLPTTTVVLSGSGTDLDGSITAYQWTKIAGPASGTISNTANPVTTATGLVAGVYSFALAVTGNDGTIARDTMQLRVTSSLPLQLLDFTAEKTSTSKALLKWTTANEENTSRFEIMKGRQPSTLQYAGTVSSVGNSNVAQNYNYVDAAPYSGYTYYQLKMIDRDGSYTLSPVVRLNFDKSSAISVYPNPVTNQQVFINSGDIRINKVTLLTMDGRQIACDFVQGSTQSSVKLPATISKGMYILQLATDNGSNSMPVMVE